MKKVFSLLVCLTLILGLGVLAYAEGEGRYGREDQRSVGYVDSKSTAVDGILSAAPVYIYGATIFASSASAYVLIYDNASAESGTVKIEVGGATQYNTVRQVYDPPIRMENGAYADVTNCSVWIEYR